MPTTDAQALAEQLLLGRYRVLETRGEGGFGTVYVCWDPRLMRRVAIKSIRLKPQAPQGSLVEGVPDYLSDARRSALLRAALDETRTASMLPHPNIVQMIEFDNDDEHAYIIMEYVEGASLAELLDATEDGLLTADEAAAVVEGVCDALEFAHDNGVLHLDIKPDNIMVDMSGRVKLADFGMATLSSMTGYSGARGGTVGYMPPEQAEGGEVDVRTDVFAFAAVMYEALCGFSPFNADTLARSRELVLAGAPDPCALSDSIDVRAADALLDALEPDPDARTPSAAEFAAQILPALGRPRQGRRSLAGLVRDVLDDSQPAEAAPDDETPPIAAPIRSFDPDSGILGAARAPSDRSALPRRNRHLGTLGRNRPGGHAGVHRGVLRHCSVEPSRTPDRKLRGARVHGACLHSRRPHPAWRGAAGRGNPLVGVGRPNPTAPDRRHIPVVPVADHARAHRTSRLRLPSSARPRRSQRGLRMPHAGMPGGSGTEPAWHRLPPHGGSLDLGLRRTVGRRPQGHKGALLPLHTACNFHHPGSSTGLCPYGK